MRVLKRLLIATDFSPGAERATRAGIDLGRRYGSEVHLVYVMEPPAGYKRLIAPPSADLLSAEEILRRAREGLERAAVGARSAGLVVTYDARQGRSFAEIIAAARERGSDLIVLGTRAVHDATSLLLGTTAERVVRKSTLPVLIVKKELPETPRRILLPVDFSSGSRRSAEEGIALARRWGSQAVFLHVIEPVAQTVIWPAEPGTLPIFPVEPNALEEEWSHFLGAIDLEGVDWLQSTAQGKAAEMILQSADENGADLIVVGTHGYTGLMHVLLGSVAETVVRNSRCSVITVRPDAFQFELP